MLEPITVFIVDGDESVRRAMARLMRANGFQAVCEESVDSLLQRNLPANEAILLVDVKTARESESSLHEHLATRGSKLPVIFLTDCDTESTRRQAMLEGAASYFRKPVDGQALMDAITFAVQQNTTFKPKAT